jgi:uncharacterized phage infection (PIP) family protein YhgE
MNSENNTHLGKKILYSLVIGMSGLILLLSLAGIIGVWVVERPIADAAVSVLKVVENSSQVIRQANSRVDQTLAALEAKTTDIANSSQQLSQNVNDKGLVMVLLPEEKEQQLTETADSVRDTYSGIRESIAKGLDLYRSINRIPFVSLPGLSDDQVDKLESGMAQIQTLVTTLRSGIADIRSGVTGAIDKVSATADLLTKEILRARDASAQVDSSLAALEALSVRLQQVIPGILVIIAVILSLIFAFLIFTQVEVIRLYIDRWRLLGRPQEMLPAETLAQPPQEGEAGSESE